MARNSAEGNRTRTARYRAALATRGIRPVQVLAPESAHALLRQAAGLMTREQDPLDPRAAMRQVGGSNAGERANGSEPEMKALAAKLDAAEDRARALVAELEEAQEASRYAEQAKAAEVAGALARMEAAEQEQGKAIRELAAAKAEAAEAVDALRGELAGIRGRGGWRGVLLRLTGL